MLKRIIRLLPRLPSILPYVLLDWLYLPLDRSYICRTRNIRRLPDLARRKGGRRSYAEWAYTVGVFQTLLFETLDKRDGVEMLDVGCGTGFMAIAAEPFLGPNGRYVGIDVMKGDIDYCRKRYRSPGFEFIHFDINNPEYAPTQQRQRTPWPLDGGAFDLVTASSVWTHLNEDDALFYMAEVARVLKPGGKALITFFLMDELYQSGLGARSHALSRYHETPQDMWVFDQPAYGSRDWFCPTWARVPESAIGVTTDGFNRLVTSSGLGTVRHYQGTWKETPGPYFQDVVVFKKS
jgi:SAM-dependent methyltransferase